MTKDRYRELQRFGSKLTKEEIAEGWHYCLEWDDMLATQNGKRQEFVAVK